MKTLKPFKKQVIICFSFLLLCSVTFGSSFKAVASGDWSSSTTWGGTAPSYTNTGDDIVIPSGITVTMDNNVTLNGVFSSLDVEGALSGSSSTYLTIATGTVSGAGNITTGWVTFGTAAILTFTGSVSADYYSNSAALTLKSSADIIVNKSMTLSNGILSIESGGNLTLNSNSNLMMSGGSLISNGGTLTLTSSYNVNYSSPGITGAELTGSGLHNVTINVSSGSSVTMSGDMNVDTLKLTSGILALNNHNLKINGDIQSNENAFISSTSSSDISINSANSTTGYIAFSSSGSNLHNLTINITNGGSFNLDSSNANLKVNGVLTLTKGNLNIGNNTLTISSSGSISGGSNSSYIITGTKGYVAMSLTAGASTASSYPIGTSKNYFPAEALLNSGSSNGTIMVNVRDNIYAHGATGSMLSTTQPAVNATWNFASDITGNTNMKMTLMWSANAEVNSFDHSHSYISHYSNDQWDKVAPNSAATGPNNMYEISRDNINSFSPFAVFDQSTAAIDPTGYDPTSSINIFPNPATDNIYITNKFLDGNEPCHVEIINLTGQLVGSYLINGSENLNISQLSPGIYNIRVYNLNGSSAVKKLIKL